MIITGLKNIRSIESHLNLSSWDEFYIWILSNSKINSILNEDHISIWDKFLPNTRLSKYAKYNVDWKVIINKTQREVIRRELPYKVRDWHWKEHTWTYFRDYNRYKRESICNYNFEFATIEKWWDLMLFVNKKFKFWFSDNNEIIFWINMILSIFWEVNILNQNMSLYDNYNYTRRNWEILPHWQSPFERIKFKIYNKYSQDYKRIPIIKRQEFLKELWPSEIVVWSWGFSDYNAYIYKSKKITILESIDYGNAIYILWEKWEEISKKTKKEILEWGLELERIIHENNYYNKIRKYFL